MESTDKLAEYTKKFITNPDIIKAEASALIPGGIEWLRSWATGQLITHEPETHYWYLHLGAGGGLGSLIYSNLQKKMSKAKATVATLGTMVGTSGLFELFEHYYIFPKNEFMAADSTVEQISDTVMITLGTLFALWIDYSYNRSLGSSGEDKESSMV